MSEIQEDIMKAAKDALQEWHADPQGRLLVEVVAKAILAERQRCAKIADHEADKLRLRDVADKRRDPLNKQIVAMKVACRDIASAIRGEVSQ